MQSDEFIDRYLAAVRTAATATSGTAAMPIGAAQGRTSGGDGDEEDDGKVIAQRIQTVFEARIEQIRTGLARQDQRVAHRRLPAHQRLFAE